MSEEDDDLDEDLYGSDDTVREILAAARTWFVVGLGDNPARAAYGVGAFLQARGRRIVPIHPSALPVHGQPGYASIAEATAAMGPADVVDVFVRSELAGAIADDAIAAGASAVWFQLGVVDEDAAARVRGAGIGMVMDRCPAQEWAHLGPTA